MAVRSLILFAFLLTSLLAGCLSGEDVPSTSSEDHDGTDVQSDAGLGTIKGTVLTTSLDPVVNGRVNLVQDQRLVAETTTNSQGRYALANVEPGDYLLQFSSICCKEKVKGVRVAADTETNGNIQLDPLTSDDLQEGRIEQNEWTGFLSCTVRTPAIGVSVCSFYDPTGQDDFLHEWTIGKGVKSVVGALVWDAPGVALGEELRVLMEVAGNSNSPPTYVRKDGVSPLEYRVEEGFVIETYSNEGLHMYDFSNVEESLELQFRLFAGGDVNVVYQQKFTMYWDLYYWEAAPEHATAAPDL